MYARVTAMRVDPSRIDQGITKFNEVLPTLRPVPGYAGAALLVNRDTGEGFGVTYWDTVAHLNAAEKAGLRARQQSSEATGAEVTDVDRFDMVLIDRASDPSAPSFARVNQLYGDLDRLEDGIAFLRDKVVPSLSKQKGYLSALMGVNRMTGRMLVTSNWRTAEDRAASEASVASQRTEAASVLRADPVEVMHLEVAAVEIKQPTRTR
jgi:heme-degrading monooxygenase HmoA